MSFLQALQRNEDFVLAAAGNPGTVMVGTVDGSEIQRSPAEVGSLSHSFSGFSTIPGGCLGFEP